MKLHFEKGAVLPRCSGQTTSRLKLLRDRLWDLHQYYGTTSTLKIVYVVQKVSIGKLLLKQFGISDQHSHIIVTTPENLKHDIKDKEVFDIIVDYYMLSLGSTLTLEFK